MWQIERKRGVNSGFNVQLKQARHLPVAILLDHINAFMLLNKFMHFARERIRAHPQIIRLQFVFIQTVDRAIQ